VRLKHHLLNPDNVDHSYPNDGVLRNGETDSLLYSYR